MELPIARGSHSLFLDSCAAHEGQGTCGTPGIAVRSRNVPASLINDPEHWRDRAREKRELAERLTNEQAKQTVLRVANEYERLAEQAEERSRGSPQSK